MRYAVAFGQSDSGLLEVGRTIEPASSGRVHGAPTSCSSHLNVGPAHEAPSFWVGGVVA